MSAERMSIVWAGPYRRIEDGEEVSVGAAVYGGRPVVVSAPRRPVQRDAASVFAVAVSLGTDAPMHVEVGADRGFEEAVVSAVRIAMFREARGARRGARPAPSRPVLAEAA
ncbi:MAG: hypothetical protein AB7G37_02630 [Solirubrobacteraceae bacterium]